MSKKRKTKKKAEGSFFWKENDSTQISISGKVLLASIVFLCLPTGKILWDWHDFKGAYLINRDKLSTTQGEILSSTTYTSSGRRRDTTYYHYSIKYQFEYDGKIFRSDEVTFDSTYRTFPEFAEKYIDRYKEGSVVTVYFDSKNPSFSVLEPENIDYTGFGLCWISLFISFIGFVIIGCVLINRKFLSEHS